MVYKCSLDNSYNTVIYYVKYRRFHLIYTNVPVWLKNSVYYGNVFYGGCLVFLE